MAKTPTFGSLLAVYELLFARRDGRLETEERAFCEEWMRLRERRIVLYGAVAGALFHTLSIATDPFIVRVPIHATIMRPWHIAFVISVILFFRLVMRRNWSVRIWAVPIHLLSIATYVALHRHNIEHFPTLDAIVVRSWTALLGISVFQA